MLILPSIPRPLISLLNRTNGSATFSAIVNQLYRMPGADN